MSVRSGVAAQLGIKTETTYGTYAAPTTFVPFTSESLRLQMEYIRTAGLRAGRLSQAENLHAATTRSASGSVSFDALDSGLGSWLNQLHGNTVTPASLTGGLYLQRHNVGTTDNYNKSLTVQVGRPDVSGTVQPFSYLGCKATQATFTLERGGVVAVSVDLDAQDEVTSQSLAAATYSASADVFNFINASVEFDDVVLTDCVRAATVTVPIALATDRYCIGNGALKKQPVNYGLIAPTITLDMEFSSLTQQTAFKSATRRKVELNCTGTTSSGTYASALNFTAASTVTTGEGPVVDGPDLLSQSLTLEVLDDGTNVPLVIDYISSDASIG